MQRLMDEDLIAIEARASEASHNVIAFGVFALMPIVQDDLPRSLADLRRYKKALEEIGPDCSGALLRGFVPVGVCSCPACIARRALADDEEDET